MIYDWFREFTQSSSKNSLHSGVLKDYTNVHPMIPDNKWQSGQINKILTRLFQKVVYLFAFDIIPLEDAIVCIQLSDRIAGCGYGHGWP